MVRQHWKRLKTIGGNMVVGPKTIPSRKPLAYMDKNHWPLGKIKKNRHISSSLSEGSSHEDRVDNHSGVWVSFSIQQMESRTASIFYLFTCPDGGCKRRNYPNSVWLKQMWRNNDSWNRFCPSRDGDPGAWRSEGADYMFSKDILTDHWRMTKNQDRPFFS